MAKTTSEDVMAQLQQILSADDAAGAGEARKFSAAFRAQLQSALTTFVSAQQAISGSESDRSGARELLDQAQGQAKEWIRSVHNRLKGLPPTVNKSALAIAYGFPGGKLGELSSERIMTLLTLFPVASAAQSSAEAKLPADWLSTLAALKTQIETQTPLANIGARGDRVKARDAARAVCDDLLSRVFGWLCYALPLRDRDPLMNSYGFTPRQLPRPKATPGTPTPPA